MNNKEYKLKQQGFTLIELLVALGLTALVTTGLMSVFWLSHNAFIREQNQADMQYSARHARDILVRDIRASKTIEVWIAQDTPVSSPQDSGSWLSLQVENNGSTQQINYYVANNVLYRDNVSAHPNNKLPIASNLESISFTSPKPTLVNIMINTRIDEQVYSLSSSMSRRID
ncbi:MAG: PilW family protein [Methylocystaceae bacterium]